MEMKDLEDQMVQIGKTSITVKNKETGKTSGIVRDVWKWDEIANNKRMDYWPIIRSAGLLNRDINLDHLLFKDDELYFLYSLKCLEGERELKNHGCQNKLDEYAAIITKTINTGSINVIPVYDFWNC